MMKILGWRSGKPWDAFDMTKSEYIELIGEDPEEMFGGDWENTLAELTEEDFICPMNNCGNPKMHDEDTCGDKESH